jgi:hypothetical protein
MNGGRNKKPRTVFDPIDGNSRLEMPSRDEQPCDHRIRRLYGNLGVLVSHCRKAECAGPADQRGRQEHGRRSEIVSTILFAISFLVLLWSVRVRYERQKYLVHELEGLQRDRDFAEIYGGDIESREEEKKRKGLEQGGDHEQRLTFELVCWSLHIVGTALAVVGAAIWLNEDQGHSVADLAKYVFFVLILAWFAWITLRAEHKFARLERDIVWLKWVLKGVHSSAVNMRRSSIDEYVELNDRVENFEKK